MIIKIIKYAGTNGVAFVADFIVLVLLLSIGIIYLSTSVSDTNKLKAGFTPEFMGRQDGDLGLRSEYGLNVHPVVVNDAVMYKAAFEKELDLISGYSTDGRIKAFDLYVLEDDKKIFPPYFAAPIIKMKTLEKFPELEKTLNDIPGVVTNGIFAINKADIAIVATNNGIEERIAI